MRTRVQRWGNSLAVRIPKAFALEAGLDESAAVDLTMLEGRIVIQPVIALEFTLDELLARVDDANLHGEIGTGPGVGLEEW